MEDCYTVNEVARIVGRHRKTIYRWIDEGFLENVIRIRSGYLIPKEEVDRIFQISSGRKADRSKE